MWETVGFIICLRKGGGIKQLSHDDTYVGWLFRNGKLNEREARNSSTARNVLQKSLGGGNQFVDPQIGAVAHEPGGYLSAMHRRSRGRPVQRSPSLITCGRLDPSAPEANPGKQTGGTFSLANDGPRQHHRAGGSGFSEKNRCIRDIDLRNGKNWKRGRRDCPGARALIAIASGSLAVEILAAGNLVEFRRNDRADDD